MKITSLRALEVFDSRGMPTLKVSMEVDGAPGEFSVPAGASTGKAEARELRDEQIAESSMGFPFISPIASLYKLSEVVDGVTGAPGQGVRPGIQIR